MTKYFKLEGIDTVIKITIDADKAEITEWTSDRWVTPDTDYSGIFIGEIPVDEIREGDAEWNRLGLLK